ncbi:MAG: DUF1287 domain-containing protein [Acinetobacter sp.]|nr:DUF1287 domain-containing protein [Acinetobacter sp.]
MELKFSIFFILMMSLVINMQAFAIKSQQIVLDARQQIGQTLYYDPAYTTLKYPMGDVPMIKGVCTDVIIRALRLQGVDLQKLIHEDMKKSFAVYPKKWGLKSTDRNIDHRRVPNIMTYFNRQGYEVKDKNYKAGDIVTWDLGKGLVHIGIISNQKSLVNSTPLVIHNIGSGTQENNILFDYKITGHYRIAKN